MAGPDGVAEACPVLVVWILPWGQHILVTHIVWSLIDYPESPLHSDGVTVADVAVQVAGVSGALMGLPLVVSVLVEDDLEKDQCNMSDT